MKLQVSKDIVVTALITDVNGKVLIVKPEHKEGWIFPGGYVEVGESPSKACQREIGSELGVEIQRPDRLLSVDYHSRSSEYIMFIFDGGTFTTDIIASIKLLPRLLDCKFVEPEEALSLLRPNSARRLMPTIEARAKGTVAYLEHQVLFS